MAYETLLIDTGDDFVATITLNRPEQLNTFTTQIAVELEQALWELDEQESCRIIILKGAGKAFCAGIDVNEMFGKDANQAKAWVETMERPLVSMSRIKKPVIAQVQGVAAANGGGLVAAADLAICADNARIGYTAVKVGLFCLGPAVPLFRMVGRKRAMDLLLSGRLIKADEALEMGLVNRVVPGEDLDAEARAWAAELAALSPLGVQLSKQALYSMADLEYGKAFDLMNEAFARLCTTLDAVEGCKAFLEKREPVWRNK